MGRNYYAAGNGRGGPGGRPRTSLTRTISSGSGEQRQRTTAQRETASDLDRLRRAVRQVQSGGDVTAFSSLAAQVRARIAARGSGASSLRTVDNLLSQANRRAAANRRRI